MKSKRGRCIFQQEHTQNCRCPDTSLCFALTSCSPAPRCWSTVFFRTVYHSAILQSRYALFLIWPKPWSSKAESAAQVCMTPSSEGLFIRNVVFVLGKTPSPLKVFEQSSKTQTSGSCFVSQESKIFFAAGVSNLHSTPNAASNSSRSSCSCSRSVCASLVSCV